MSHHLIKIYDVIHGQCSNDNGNTSWPNKNKFVSLGWFLNRENAENVKAKIPWDGDLGPYSVIRYVDEDEAFKKCKDVGKSPNNYDKDDN